MKKLYVLVMLLMGCVAFGCGEESDNSDVQEQVQLGEVTQAVCPAGTGTLTGTIKYTRQWGNCDNTSRIKCSDNNTAKGYGTAVISAQGVAVPGAVVLGTTNTSGVYTMCVPGGDNYKLRVHHREASTDLTAATGIGLGTAGNFAGRAQVALVSNFTPPTEIVDVLGTSAFVGSGSTNLFNVTVAANTATDDRMNTYMEAKVQRDVWLTEYSASPTLCPNLTDCYRIRVREMQSSPSATGSTQCQTNNNPPNPSSNCFFRVIISYAQTKNGTTLFHETGHAFDAWAGLQTGGRIRPYDATLGCVGSPHNDNEGVSLTEGIADWVDTITKWSTTTVPQGNNGIHCNLAQYSPTGPQPNPPACGVGAIPNSEFRVEKALIDVVDSNAIPNEAGCRNEQIALSPSTVLSALTKFTHSTSSGACPGNSPGVEEAGITEGSFCSPSTPNFPYTGANALPVVDQESLLDLLGILKTQFGASGTQLFSVWANSGWERGDTSVALP